MIARPSRSRYDVIVVGARCAGAATAMLLARRELAVLCVDRGRYGADTLSTHALMRGAVQQLQRWGLLARIREAGVPRVARTSFHYGDEVVDVDIRPREGVDGLYAPRRPVIDAILVDGAQAAGAELVFGARLVELARGGDGRVRGVRLELGGDALELEASLVVGADGARSTVAELVGAAIYARAEHTTSLIYSYWAGVGLDGYHWYYRPGVSAGAIATNGGMCVFAAMPPSRFERERRDLEGCYRAVLDQCDRPLAAALAGAERLDRYRAFAGLRGYFRQSHGPGWALVGDAGYFKDPITAHGITDALIDAEQLADAIHGELVRGEEGALAGYQARRDARGTELFEITDTIASLDWEPSELQQLHRALSSNMKRETAELDRLEPLNPQSTPSQPPAKASKPMTALNLEVGQTATRSNTFTLEHVEKYAEISGDQNPLHFDAEFVAKTPFGRPVVHGGLTSGILNALVAQDMPGPGTVFMSMELKFTKPVFIGDTITAKATVLEVHASKPVCKLAVEIRRDDGGEGEVVLTGETWCYQFQPEG